MRFNQSARSTQREEMLSGGVGFRMTPEMELYTMVCASMLTPTYYTPNTNDQINKIKSLIRKVDPVFVAQMATYAREQMYLRTIPLVLTVELAKTHRGDNLIRRMSNRVIQRADEITEMLSYYVKANNLKPKNVKVKGGHVVEKKIYKLSNQLRKGIADSFMKFDEYQFAKYNRATEIKLRDALFLTHPKPRTAEQKELFNRIAQDTLETPYTWETQQSKAGQEGRDKGEVWQELIDSNRLNYMAMMRNLANFLRTGVSKSHIEKVARFLADPNQVRKSKQLPFRFLAAYRSIGGGPQVRWMYGPDNSSAIESPHTPILLNALEEAVKVSVENIPSMKGNDLLIASDVSGSMQRTISEKSTIQHYDIGLLLGLLVKHVSPTSVFGIFGDSWKPLSNTPVEDVLGAVNRAHKREGEVGYGTHGYKVLDWALNRKQHFDKIMFFTDGQMYGSGHDLKGINDKWKIYKSQVNPEAKLYLFNLQPYGQSPFDLKQNDTYMISGFSEKIFTMLDSIEKGEDALALIKEIRV